MTALLDWLTRRTLLAATLAGALARLVSAVVGLGFHARDDYFHVLAPALRWLDDPTFVWEQSDLPGAGLRSHLVPRLVCGLVFFTRKLGVHDPETTLRILHVAAGAYSLLAVPGMYLLASRLVSPRAARIATWLAALHFAMPYLGTRLLIEAMAIPPLLFGFWLLTFTEARKVVLGGVLIGCACWLRYQVAVIAIGAAMALALDKRYRDVAWLAVGGVLAMVLQGAFDWLTVGKPFAPMLANIAVNAEPPQDLTRMSPLTYVWAWLALTIPPATVVLVPAMWRGVKSLRLVWLPFALFVIAHMLIAHKEERFMAPALPFFLLMLATAPDALATMGGLLKRLAMPLAVWFVALHVVVLAIAVTHQSQAGQRHALAALREDKGAIALIAMGPEVPTFYLGEHPIPVARNGEVDAVWLRRAMRTLDADATPANRFLAFAGDGFKVTLLLEAMELDCVKHAVFEGSLIDRLVYRVNPEHNRRRAPVVLWSCERPEVASVL